MNKKIRNQSTDFLFDAILQLQSREECYSFFEDLCTINEILSLSQRFEVAAMLRQHETYLKIAEQTGASTATISRVNRSLNYGTSGYDMVLDRIRETAATAPSAAEAGNGARSGQDTGTGESAAAGGNDRDASANEPMADR